ncbi:MAG TPA: response regulator [Bryobacteraceae bacterium]|nr:response regulator [Bryobacteraceae bacterium]
MADSASGRVILYLEDDDPTAQLFEEVVRDLRSTVQLYRVTTCTSAMAFLRRETPFNGVPEPHVIILDINVPGGSGFSVLRAVRSDPRFARLPVIIFSSSNTTSDLIEARELGANGYMVKSVELSAFTAAAELALSLAA